MTCLRCGSETPAGAQFCPACGFSLSDATPAAPAKSGSQDPLEQAMLEVKRAAKELANATAQFSKRAAATADKAARDPSGTAKRAVERVKKEVDGAVADLSDLLRKL
jgi:hypothetical protein